MRIFYNDTATTEIYTLSLHDALPISPASASGTSTPTSRASSITTRNSRAPARSRRSTTPTSTASPITIRLSSRSEEHTSELQSRQYLVCRLLLEKQTDYCSHYLLEAS